MVKRNGRPISREIEVFDINLFSFQAIGLEMVYVPFLDIFEQEALSVSR